MVVSIDLAEHYTWGEVCDGWHLLKREDMSVVHERVPPGAAEVMHYHTKARQFFYILEGEGEIIFEDELMILEKGQGVEIAPLTRHQFKNRSSAEVHFLVISVPPTKGDRVNV